MAGVELANAWVNIIPNTSKIAPQIKSAFGEVEPVVQKKGHGIGTGLSSAIGKTLKVGAVSAGAAAGGLLAGAMAKGFSRLSSIENAEAKLKGLGNSAEQVSGIMDNALGAVKGTAFGMGEAATVASQIVASGIKPGQELERVLKTVGDTAAITGDSMEGMGMIFGSVAARGKLMGDDLMQLRSRGLPVMDILAESLGKTTEEVEKMATNGEISFEIFEKAMREKMGGAALEMGTTVQGALSNVGASMGRFGEAVLKPVYDASPKMLTAFGGVFDKMTDAIGPSMERIGTLLTPALESLAGIIDTDIAPAMADFAGWLGDVAVKITEVAVDPENWRALGDLFGSLRDAAADMGPSLGNLAASFAQIAASISVATWQALAAVLNALAPLITSVLVPLVEQVANFAAQNPGAVQAIVTAFLGFKAVSSIAGPVGTAVTTIKNLGGAAKFAHTAFKGASLGEGLLNLMAGAKSANPAIAKVGSTAVGAGKGLAKGSMVAASTGSAFGKMGKFLAPIGGLFSTIGRVALQAIRFINPWVAGFTLVTSALTLFFTKTEWGRALWESFTQAIGAGWDWIVGKFQAGISWISTTFGPVFSQIGQVISGAWDATVEKVSGAMARVKEIISGALTFWQTGETTDFAAALGISEDSPIFTALTFLRDKIVEVKDFAIEAWGQMQEKWAEFTTGFGEFYQTWIQPVIDAFGMAFSAIVPVVTAAWDMLGSAVSTVWNGVIKPVFDAFMQVASVVFPAIAAIVKTVVGAAFRIMGDVISSTWNNVIRPAWNVMRTVFGIVADVLTGNFSNLGNRFSELGHRIMSLVGGLFTNAFNSLKSVVTNSLNAAKAVIGIFKQAVISMVNISKEKINSLVAGFQAMPGRIRAAFAGAGSWLLDAGRSIISGLAQGVRNAAGMVEDAVRAVIPDNLERFVPGLHIGGVVPAFARGGVLPNVPGFTRNDRDPILGWSKEKKQPIARVEPGEFIVNRDATKKYGRLLAAINGGKFDSTKGDFGLPGYAKGGVVTYDQAYRFLRGESINGSHQPGSLEGSPYVWGGGLNANWGDCSGTQSAIASLVAGVGTTGRKFATGTQGGWLAQNGFRRGRGPGKNAFETAYFNGGPYGGHTAGTLFDSKGRSVNVEMGGGRGNGQIGGPAAGSRHSQFTDVWWHPLKSAAGKALANRKVVSTSTKGVTVDAGEGNKFQAETIDWGEASQYGTDWEKENKRKKNLRRWSAGIFDTGGILKPGNFAFNASGKPERVLDPRLTVAVEKVAETSPALAKSMDNLAKVNWNNVGSQVSDGWAKRMDGYQSFAGAQARSIQQGDKIGSYLSNVGLSEGLGLADQIGSLIGIDGIKSTFGGVVGAFEDMEDAAVAEVDAADAVKQAEKNLAKARKEGSPEDVKAAEEELTKARGAVQLAARATGQAQIAMMVELASLAINLIKGVFKFIEGKIQGVMQAHVTAFKAVGSAMESVGKLDAEVLKLRESVTGLVIDQAMAQIELAAAARNVRIAQMDGVTSQLQATKTLAEAQAAFDEQRKADMRLAAMGYDDLSLAYDRFRWGMLDANGDVMDQMAAWSDESHALYSELLAAQVNQQLVEKQAQRENLEAAYKHTLAVISLNDVTANLEVAAKKLAVASGHAFGMDQVGATVGQRYAELMGEKASLQADQASLKTWLNPVNWFTTMPANQRRIKQIDQQLAQLKAMPEFKNVDQSALTEMDKVIKASGWMGFFGAGDKVDEMIKNSALGDASRALEQMEFENRLIDLKSEQDDLRRKVEKNLAEVEYRKKLDPLETLIAGLEQERDSNKTWAEYWRTDNENIRKALADLAGHQADYAGELKRMSAEPNKVVQISGDNFSREQLEAAMAELGVRVERLERPRASASQVVASRR
ncbi:tape measure protein [Corynebacterium tuberculostearicum]|uniref:Tape measure protein n=1 Tax=Corynebacterium tuberculostearicum TaxID=38304 RepID=A0AAE4NNZ1_9CORY|nr:tape measure protein [Corynebacterium tuberculostearicum]MDV2420226.1 tape measure protein [Corynebacterium tuberculostearicum]